MVILCHGLLPMTLASPIRPDAALAAPAPALAQRALGDVRLAVRQRDDGRTVIDRLRHGGSMRCVFPGTARGAFQAVFVNTSGGITGGDRFDIQADAGPGTALALTTQTAERAYRALPGQPGTLRTRLQVGPNAVLSWLPQETILFDGADLDRRLDVGVAATGRFMMIEPVVLGRRAMGETLRSARFRDRVRISLDGAPVWRDGFDIEGDAEDAFDRAAIGAGARAYATLVWVGAGIDAAASALAPLQTSGTAMSRLSDHALVCRILARDGFDLRKAMMPMLDALVGDSLPTCWRL